MAGRIPSMPWLWTTRESGASECSTSRQPGDQRGHGVHVLVGDDEVAEVVELAALLELLGDGVDRADGERGHGEHVASADAVPAVVADQLLGGFDRLVG